MKCLFICLFILLITSSVINTAPIGNYQRLITYLTEFGYLSQANQETGRTRSHDEIVNAVTNLQQMAGLPQTGNMDDLELENVIELPRCGVGDNRVVTESLDISTFDPSGSKWHKKEITFQINNYYPGADQEFVRSEILRALDVWKSASDLTFIESETDVDILVAFHRKEHGDGYPFDGPGGSFAHAFPPGPDRGGDVHFDDEEIWNKIENTYDLFRVAVHEFGHSLGVLHSSLKDSAMHPWSSNLTEGLSSSDVKVIRSLYFQKNHNHSKVINNLGLGQGRLKIQSSSFKNLDDAPDPCLTDIDALAIIDYETFVLKGQWFWRFDHLGNFVDVPTLFYYFWTFLPMRLESIDAITPIPRTGQTLLFSGKVFWKIKDRSLGETPSQGYPLSKLGLPEEVTKIDAALTWGESKRIYLFSGYVYWRMDNSTEMVTKQLRVETGYPKSVDLWKGVPFPIDSAFTDFDGSTYFFNGMQMYKIDNDKMEVDPTYPRHIRTKWPHCRFKLNAIQGSTRKIVNGLLVYSLILVAGSTR